MSLGAKSKKRMLSKSKSENMQIRSAKNGTKVLYQLLMCINLPVLNFVLHI